MAYPTGLIKLGFKVFFDLMYRSFLWLVLLLVSYLLLIRLVVILLPFYQSAVLEAFDESADVELSLGSVNVSQDRLKPELLINDVRIKTEDESVDLTIDIGRVQGKLSLLKSLFSLQPVFEEVYFYNVDFETEINQLSLGAEEGPEDIGLNWLTQWLEAQQSIMLYNISGAISRFDKRWSFDELDARWYETDKRYLLVTQEQKPIIRAHYQGSIFDLSESNLHAEGEIHPGSLVNTLLNQTSKMEDASLAFYVRSDSQSLQYSFETRISDYVYQAFKPVMIEDIQANATGSLNFENYFLDLELESLTGLINTKPIDSQISARFDLSNGAVNSLYLDRFSIQQASQLAQFELEDEFQRLIAQFSPRGWIEDIIVQGDISNLDNIIVTGNIKDFSIKALGDFPGLRDVDIAFTLFDSKVLVEFDDDNLVIDYDIFDNSLGFEIQGNALFQQWKDYWKLESGLIKLKDAHQETLLNFSLVRDALFQLDFGIQAESQLDDIAKAGKYVPFELLSSDLTNWLKQAFSTGQGERLSILYQDNLLDFSSIDSPSPLSLGIWAKNTPVRFLADWPELFINKGSMIYHRDDVFLSLIEGELMGNVLEPLSGRIYNDGIGTRLKLSPAKFSGDNQLFFDAMRGSEFFVNIVPEDILELDLKGPMHGIVYLDIPFYDSRQIDAVLDVNFYDNTLKWKNWPRDIEQVAGHMLFDLQEAITLNSVTGQTIGFPFELDARYDFNDNTFIGEGKASQFSPLNLAEVYFEPSLINNLRPYSEGKTDAEFAIYYDGKINQGDVKFSTELIGLSSKLPYPFEKQKQESWNTLITIPLGEGADVITASLDDHNMEFGISEQGGLGAIAIGFAGQPERVDGQINLTGKFDKTSFFPWLEFITGWKSEKLAVEQAEYAQGSYLAGLPINLDLDIDDLEITSGWQVPKVNFIFNERLDSFDIGLDSEMMAGQINLPKALNQEAVTKIAMQHFALPEVDANKKATKERFYRAYNLDHWGQFNIAVDKLFFGDKLLGEIALVAEVFPSKIDFNDIRGDILGFEVIADGQYSNTNGVLLNKFNGQAIGKNFESLLEYNELPELAKGGGPLTVDYSVYWPGRLESVNLEDMTGSFLFNAEKGSILALDKTMNYGLKFLSFLNIENWRRRLNLDFADVSSSGASFNEITAAASLDNAQVDIDYAYVYGPGFRTHTHGAVDVRTQEMELETTVQLPVNTSDPFTCALGLPVCVGGFFWELFTGKEFKDVTNRDFRVTGKLSEPQLEPIDN